MVAAAGNDATRIRMYPASFAGVVSVSAVDSTNTIAEFSNTGVAVDLAAPGVDLISTIPGGDYALGTGTSMSSPHVAGVAALVRAARPGLDVDEVEAVLRASAVDLGAPGHDIVYGDGLVDAAAALVAPVPDPIPNLDPPTPLPSLSLSFLAPTSRVVQTATTYTVQIAVDHDVVESIALLGSWPQTNGHCKNDGKVHVKELTFGTTIELKHLQPGKCYQVYVAAVDDDFNYNEALSPIIKILDVVGPRGCPSHARRRARMASAGRPTCSVRFSEPVVLKGTPVVLRNAHTGKAVPATTSWDAHTLVLVVNPVNRLQAHTRYRVEVGLDGRRPGRQPPRAGPLGVRHRVLTSHSPENRTAPVREPGPLHMVGAARGAAGVSATRQAATMARPWASCAASAQSIRQPRASRPPIGAKWNQSSSPFAARCSRQPQALQVIGPLRPSMASAMWLVSKAG